MFVPSNVNVGKPDFDCFAAFVKQLFGSAAAAVKLWSVAYEGRMLMLERERDFRGRRRGRGVRKVNYSLQLVVLAIPYKFFSIAINVYFLHKWWSYQIMIFKGIVSIYGHIFRYNPKFFSTK